MFKENYLTAFNFQIHFLTLLIKLLIKFIYFCIYTTYTSPTSQHEILGPVPKLNISMVAPDHHEKQEADSDTSIKQNSERERFLEMK